MYEKDYQLIFGGYGFCLYAGTKRGRNGNEPVGHEPFERDHGNINGCRC